MKVIVVKRANSVTPPVQEIYPQENPASQSAQVKTDPNPHNLVTVFNPYGDIYAKEGEVLIGAKRCLSCTQVQVDVRAATHGGIIGNVSFSPRMQISGTKILNGDFFRNLPAVFEMKVVAQIPLYNPNTGRVNQALVVEIPEQNHDREILSKYFLELLGDSNMHLTLEDYNRLSDAGKKKVHLLADKCLSIKKALANQFEVEMKAYFESL